VADIFLTTDPRRRIRIAQWSLSIAVYISCASVLWFGMLQGTEYQARFPYWAGFVLVGQAAFFVALRSGWSERFPDPALTSPQILVGVVIVYWGYLICGPVRTAALLPLLLIFTFGAFSLSLRRIAQLTAFALAGLVATIIALHVSREGGTWTLSDADLRLDATNFLMIVILLPALSLVAARLSALRSKLRSQREALSAALEEVERLATRDELTGLANRRHAQAQLEQELQRYNRTRHPFSIAIIDIDNFKAINDSLGHAGGDEVLKDFAVAAATALRGSDLLARWGGEEFLVLLPITMGPQAQATLERVLERVRSLPHNIGLPLSFSAGIAEYIAGEPLEETIARADRCMYRAKQCGRNRVLLAGAGEAEDQLAPATEVSVS